MSDRDTTEHIVYGKLRHGNEFEKNTWVRLYPRPDTEIVPCKRRWFDKLFGWHRTYERRIDTEIKDGDDALSLGLWIWNTSYGKYSSVVITEKYRCGSISGEIVVWENGVEGKQRRHKLSWAEQYY